MRWKAAAVVFVLAANGALLSAGPAQAGLFGSDAAPAPVASDGIVNQIQQALDDQRFVDAGSLLDRALISGISDPRLALLGGELNLSRGRYDAALASFKQIDAQPTLRARALEGEGIGMSLLGRTDDAQPVLEAAVSLKPDAWRAWNALGVIYDRRHDWAKADAAYDHAMTASNASPLVLNNRGFSRLSQGRLDDAAADFVAALQKKPDFSSARNNLRLTIAMKGDYTRATEGASATDRPSILNNAGFAAMARGDYSTAKNLLGQAIQAKGEYYSVAAANLETVHGLEFGTSGTVPNAAAH
ncbi:MAG: tetratricopeptide repeat protein [Alphaproteobacteria bacterium]|nr:tetratricopeptide repeat protein [Alphaproteobacteria bacterium]